MVTGLRSNELHIFLPLELQDIIMFDSILYILQALLNHIFDSITFDQLRNFTNLKLI